MGTLRCESTRGTPQGEARAAYLFFATNAVAAWLDVSTHALPDSMPKWSGLFLRAQLISLVLSRRLISPRVPEWMFGSQPATMRRPPLYRLSGSRRTE